MNGTVVIEDRQATPYQPLTLQIAQAPNGSQQASAAAENARLSLTTAAALAFQETSQIPGINDSPTSVSTDAPASATFQGGFPFIC